MIIESGSFTDKGGREINEDSIALAEKNGASCFVLCDGLGGHGKGELASAYVAEFIKESFENACDTDEFMETVLDKAQEGLMREQKKLGAQFEMKTTAVVLLIDGDTYRYAHIGDSRLYHFRKNKLAERTLDHSVPQMLALAGDIKEKRIRSHPDRNRLLRVMGVEWDSSRYELSEKGTLKDGDAFLLCSDGFWEPVLEKEMIKALKRSADAEDWLAVMADKAEENGKDADMDNYSAIAVRIKG